ncbi:MAG: hypothetical protein HZB16_04350 [Armatimonadetes bacterium]|nr:hypothetical protein [Armatimonadota bacterium]
MHIAVLFAALVSAPLACTWQPLPLDGGGPVTALAASPHDPALLLAGGLGSGVLRSDDGGRSWSPGDGGLLGWGDRCVAQLLYHGTDAAAAYAACGSGRGDGGLLASTDGGLHWLPRSRRVRFDALSQSRHLLLARPLDPGNLLAATLDDGVCQSADGGRSWQSLGPAGRRVLALARAADGTLFAVVAAHTDLPRQPGGLFRRRPDDASWSLVFPAELLDVVVAANDALLVASAEHGLLRSEDGGLRFVNATPAGLTPDLRLRLEVSTSAPTVVLAYGGGRPWRRVWLSTDAGQGWRALVEPPGEQVDTGDGWQSADSFGLAPQCATFDPRSPRRLWIGDDHTVWGSHDGAATWFSGHHGLRTASVTALALDPLRADRAYVGTAGAGAFSCTSRPPTALALGGNCVDLRQVSALAVPTRGGVPVFGHGEGVWLMPQPGRFKAGGPLGGLARGLLALADGGLLAEVEGQPLELSRDGGLSWSLWSPQPLRLPLFLDGSPRHALALGWADGLWRTRDGGASWESWSGDLPGPPRPSDLLAAVPTGTGPFYLRHAEALWRTREGQRWERMLPKPLRALAVDPRSGLVFAAPTEGGGIMVSGDQGETWSPLPDAPGAPIDVLAAGADGRLWVGTRGSGAFVATVTH